MSNILSNFYDNIRSSVRVSDVARQNITLLKRGGEYQGLCPFHSEKTPSFTINDSKKFYHCFGCGSHGDVIKFESETTGLSYRDAAYKIAEKFGVTIPSFSPEEEREQKFSDRIMTLMSIAAKYYSDSMNDKVREILISRGISNDNITKYNIGFAGNSKGLMDYFSNKNVKLSELESCGLVTKNSDGRYYEFFHNRIIIPIYSQFGKVIGFGGRSLGSEMPKYVNSPETSIFKKGECLYGEDVAYFLANKTKKIILVEGYFDVIGLQSSGFLNTVASLGTAVTKYQLNKLWRVANEIIVCFDGDEAGTRASKKILEIGLDLIDSNKTISFVSMVKGYDPDEFVKKFGKQAFDKILDSKLSLSEYIFRNVTQGKVFAKAEERAILEKSLESYLERIKDNLLRKNISQFFKQKCWELYNNRQIKTIKHTPIEISKKTELQSLDDIILGFLVENINKFDREKIEEVMYTIQSSGNQAHLIDLIFDILNSYQEDINLNFIEILKKTSFWSEFELLLDLSKRSVSGYSAKVSLYDILDYLLLKRYLMNLTTEFKQILCSETEDIEDRSKFYAAEIRKTKDKIQNFNTQLALNDR